MEERPTAEPEERQRSAAIGAFAWVGLEGLPDRGLVVQRLGNARRTVRSMQRRSDDDVLMWLHDEARSGALRENAACLALIEERPAVRDLVIADYLCRHPSRGLQLNELVAILAA
ncbi:hypothetical protein AB0H83_33010 [Dactylosporangium sp. NPDC050688]|uniref:hypothetical protein n=1 Tax=Dactylosporangium sp. NPDC050688 TaxID=3157217 RepID=UPI0033CB8AD2